MYSESTDPEDISVTSDALLFLVIKLQHKPQGVAVVYRIMSAVDDSHMSTVTSASFHLWRTRWSTFVQVPLASVEPSTTCTPKTSLLIGELNYRPGTPHLDVHGCSFLEACWMNGPMRCTTVEPQSVPVRACYQQIIL